MSSDCSRAAARTNPHGLGISVSSSTELHCLLSQFQTSLRARFAFLPGVYLTHGAPSVPGAPWRAITHLGTNNLQREQVHRPLAAHVCEIHKLGARQGPYKPSLASWRALSSAHQSDDLAKQGGFGSRTESWAGPYSTGAQADSVALGDVFTVICIGKPVSGSQRLEGFHNVYLKTLM